MEGGGSSVELIGVELIGLGSWASGDSASGLPMHVTAARSLAFGARTP